MRYDTENERYLIDVCGNWYDDFILARVLKNRCGIFISLDSRLCLYWRAGSTMFWCIFAIISIVSDHFMIIMCAGRLVVGVH